MSSLAQTVLTRLGRPANVVLRARAMLGGPALAHHGIQRSGTNYLLRCLRDLGCHPLNSFSGPRDHPTHKHFRWQPDKASITLDTKFANRTTAADLSQLNRIAGYPEATRHIVIQKRIDDWAVSIVNWGLRCDWWPASEAALADGKKIFTEYHCYYSEWWRLANSSGGRVEIVSLEDLLADPRRLLDALGRLAVPVSRARARKFRGVFASVAQSPPSRARFLDDEQKTALIAQVSHLATDKATPGAFGTGAAPPVPARS